MCKSCRQLACDERCQIKVLMSGGLSIREIAGELGRSPATISRERTARREATCTGASGGVAGSRTGGAAGMPGGAAFRAGWTSPSAPRWRRRRAASATGSWAAARRSRSFTRACSRPEPLTGLILRRVRNGGHWIRTPAGPAWPDCVACNAGKSRLSPFRRLTGCLATLIPP